MRVTIGTWADQAAHPDGEEGVDAITPGDESGAAHGGQGLDQSPNHRRRHP